MFTPKQRRLCGSFSKLYCNCNKAKRRVHIPCDLQGEKYLPRICQSCVLVWWVIISMTVGKDFEISVPGMCPTLGRSKTCQTEIFKFCIEMCKASDFCQAVSDNCLTSFTLLNYIISQLSDGVRHLLRTVEMHNLTKSLISQSLFKGLRLVLQDFLVTMYEGMCETGSPIPRPIGWGVGHTVRTSQSALWQQTLTDRS